MKSEIYQLALETLNARKAEIEKQIAEIQIELKGTHSKSALQSEQSQSERMKAYWAAKRADNLKSDRVPIDAKAGRRKKTAAEKKAMSEKMRAVWAKKRAQARAKATK
jgi:hypothetical protein